MNVNLGIVKGDGATNGYNGPETLSFNDWLQTQPADIQAQVFNAPGDVINWSDQYAQQADMGWIPAPASSGISTAAVIGVGLVALVLFASMNKGGRR